MEKDVYYSSKIKKDFSNFLNYINFVKCCYDDDDIDYIDPYPCFKNIYDAYELFCSKFKIKYEEDSDSVSDIISIDFSYLDSDSDSDKIII